MKLLLDENLPHQLRHEIPGHECFTVAYMGWAGIQNGELLARAKAANFHAFLTKDANLIYEQNLTNLPVAVIMLKAPSNDIVDIRPLLPPLIEALNNLPLGKMIHIPDDLTNQN